MRSASRAWTKRHGAATARLSAGQQHELQRDLDVPMLEGRNFEFVQNGCFGGCRCGWRHSEKLPFVIAMALPLSTNDTKVFAVDESVMEANASGYHGNKVPDELDWTEKQRQKREVIPVGTRRSRVRYTSSHMAVREWLLQSSLKCLLSDQHFPDLVLVEELLELAVWNDVDLR